ncbi:hypothetical protein AWP80_01435 [Escherichia coli]|nr:hypothetical protein AWP80_01435 [Escherichia coli]
MIDVLGPEKRRRRTTQEKIAIVQQSFEPGMTVSLVARQHGVAASQLFLWRKQYQEGSLTAVAAGEQVVPASELAAAMKQIKELQRLLGKKTMENELLTTGVSYTTSAVGTGYWFLQLLDRVSPSQWAAIGVLGSLLFGLLTYLTNLYFKIREDRRKAARGE